MTKSSKKIWYVRFEDTKKSETEVDGPYRNYPDILAFARDFIWEGWPSSVLKNAGRAVEEVVDELAAAGDLDGLGTAYIGSIRAALWTSAEKELVRREGQGQERGADRGADLAGGGNAK